MAATIQHIELPKKPRALDTSGNNNHGKVYSGRALEFDGVTDYLTQGASDLVLVDFSEETTQANKAWTVACWVNIDSAGGGAIQNVIGTNSNISSSFVGIDTNEKLSIYDSTNDAHRASNTALNINTWYRALWVFNGAGEIAFYLNGVADGTGVMGTNGDDADLVLRYVGMRHTGSGPRHFQGKMSDLQLWQGAFTAADAAYDYANPESLALNASGTALTEGNLKLWYPMQDGHRGQQSYILDGANTGLGVEKVTNGAFTGITQSESTTGSEWTTEVGWTISGDKAICDGSQSASTNLKQLGIVPIFKSYKVVFDIVVDAGSLVVAVGGSNAQPTITSTNTYTYYTQATQGDANFYFTAGATFVGSIDNVSVKAINDKHHATTVFLGDEQISATNNREFAGAGNWANAGHGFAVFNVNDSYAGELVAVSDEDASNEQFCILDGAHWEDADGDGPAMVEGRSYRLSFDAHLTRNSGTLSIGLANASHSLSSDVKSFIDNISTFTTQTVDFVYNATNHAELIVHAAVSSVFIARLDNFSIKEVGVATGWTDADQQLDIAQTALQSYNEMAWFDGGTDFVEVNPTTDIWNASDDEWNSVSCWAYTNSQPLLGMYWSAQNNPSLGIIDNGGNNTKYSIGYHTQNGDIFGIAIDKTLVDGKWKHWVMNWKRNSNDDDTAINASDVELFLNGVKQTLSYLNGSNSNAAATTATDDLKFMGLESGGYLVGGTITEVSAWKYQLTNAEVLELYNDGKALDATKHSNANLSAYWRNGGLGISGTASWVNLVNPGTNNGTPTVMTETLFCPQGVDGTRCSQGYIMNKPRTTSSLNLTNKGQQDGYVDLGSTTIVADNASASFVVWLKPDDAAADNYFLGTGASDSIKLNSATTIVLVANDNSKHFNATALSGPQIAAGEWIHVAITRRAADDKLRLYTNGVLREVESALDEPFAFRYIGARNHAEHTFRGQLDGFLYYNDELDDTEVLRNYKATKGSHRN